MAELLAWKAATAYAKGATVRPSMTQGSEPVALENGDFEGGDTDWDKDAGWAISTGSAYEGTYKAIFTGAGSGTIESSGTYTATAGQVIHATVKAKVLDEDDGATAFLKWYDASNVLISTSTGLESSVESGVWMQLEVTGTGPANAAYVTFGVEATRTVGASVTIDDARWDYTAPLEARRTGYRAVQEAAGVSGVVEPTWPTTVGAQVNDGTVIWEAVDLSFVEWTTYPIIESGVTEPAWPTTVGAFVRDGTANWECVSRRVEDENCPNTKVVCIINSKVFGADGDIVRFCATANPLDWSSANDAGYLPTGLQQANANDMAVLYPYRGNLCAWNPNCFQMWQTDPDPAQMALLDQMDGIGSSHPLAARAVGNELYFLANQGIRSVGIANAAQNLQAGDVGMPIDVLVQAAMVQAAIDGKKAISTYWPGMGQYWLCFGDDGETAGAGGALALACPTNISAIMGEFYSYTYVATGGTAPYTFSVVSGTLPPGLTLDEDTGVLSGTLTTAGSYSFGVQVTDALGVVAFCGWAAEVLEDTAEIEPIFLLVTGSDSGAGFVFATAEASASPTFTGIATSTGADISAGIGAVYDSEWGIVGSNAARSSTDALASFQTETLSSAAHPPQYLIAGPSGWLARNAQTYYNEWFKADAPTSAWSAFSPTATMTNGSNGDSQAQAAYIGWHAMGYYYLNYQRTLLRAATAAGPYTAVRDQFKNTAEGLDNNNGVIVNFLDGVEYDGKLYCAVIFHFQEASERFQIRWSPDGGLTFPDANIVYDVTRASGGKCPVQLAVCGEHLVAYCNGGGLLTSANGWASWVDIGMDGPNSGDPELLDGGRRLVAVDPYVFCIGTVSGVSKAVVFTPSTLAVSSPINLPIISARSISAGQ